ncbi:hypothetical protein [Curtobacterium poinsettiae]|uniref:hypothetical protein n=1 Tax=Curtobacterium poinsettiae TaxID=159612 RepID=UPI00217D93EE|nr:hypothetical protein [Curtobacterium flaccumfaciens]MCS6577401.1 hypothetical protein [Curtobacterium flaccumfaciens]
MDSRKRCEQAKAAVVRGKLGAIERRSLHRGLSATLTWEEAADCLGAGTGRILTDSALGNLFAFVCDGELLFPARQFNVDPDNPVLNYLSKLAKPSMTIRLTSPQTLQQL